MSSLLDDITAFCEARDLSEGQFGVLALNDKNFVPQLRDGRDIRVSTAEKVRRFMVTYLPADEAA
jgi:hypothetical protein